MARPKKDAAKPPRKTAKASRKPREGNKAKTGKRTQKPKPAPSVLLKTSEGLAAPIASEPNTKAIGRPSAYKPEYDDQVINWGEQGKSREWIAAKLRVHIDTLHEWMKVHPSFSEAITLAKQLELMWWEDAGQTNLTESGFSASAWSRSMAARFPTKWREKTQVDHGLSNELATLLGQLDGNGASLF
jgi:hypothetical protein